MISENAKIHAKKSGVLHVYYEWTRNQPPDLQHEINVYTEQMVDIDWHIGYIVLHNINHDDYAVLLYMERLYMWCCLSISKNHDVHLQCGIE